MIRPPMQVPGRWRLTDRAACERLADEEGRLSDAVPADAPLPGPVPLGTRLAFGLGTVAYGVKDNGMSVFLLLYYNQLLGLRAELVGLVIAVALIIDAFIDPLVGTLSDRTRTRWGRRHPWLYASALPVALAWLLLWNPPVRSETGLLLWLLALGFAVRAALSCNEIPSVAMTPELSRDYHERTLIVRYRFLFGWVGGLAMLALAYGVFLVPAPGFPDGTLNPAGYPAFAATGAAIMFATILLSALGTHRRVARPVPPDAPRHAGGLRAVAQAIAHRPFRLLMVAALFAVTGQGVIFALATYMLEFVWGFDRVGLLGYTLTLLLSAIASFVAVRPLAARLPKHRAAAWAMLVAVLFGSLPYALRLAGLIGSDGLTPTAALFVLLPLGVGNGAFITALVLVTSMMADVADDAARLSGQRNDGLYYAGYFLVQKAVTGLGILLAGFILALAGFPDGAQPGGVSNGVIGRLVAIYLALVAILGVLSAASFLRFPLRPPGDMPPAHTLPSNQEAGTA